MNVSATIGCYTSKVYRHSLYRDAGSFLRIPALRTSKITAPLISHHVTPFQGPVQPYDHGATQCSVPSAASSYADSA
ncbi:hypothetical protein AcV7_001739 [Taiwanofungus camphoratus]|nr:hypothetical protein AcV7_001739 [Antrodia cinnamomea]